MPLSQFVSLFLPEDIALLMYTLMILKNRTGSAGTEESFKNVRYSTVNDENKYKSKDYLFICFQTTIMLNKREKKTTL